MRQGSLFDILPREEADTCGLAGLMPAIRAGMNYSAGQDEEGRKMLLEKISAIAKREGVALTSGGGKTLEKDTLDKWLQKAAQAGWTQVQLRR